MSSTAITSSSYFSMGEANIISRRISPEANRQRMRYFLLIAQSKVFRTRQGRRQIMHYGVPFSQN